MGRPMDKAIINATVDRRLKNITATRPNKACNMVRHPLRVVMGLAMGRAMVILLSNRVIMGIEDYMIREMMGSVERS